MTTLADSDAAAMRNAAGSDGEGRSPSPAKRPGTSHAQDRQPLPSHSRTTSSSDESHDRGRNAGSPTGVIGVDSAVRQSPLPQRGEQHNRSSVPASVVSDNPQQPRPVYNAPPPPITLFPQQLPYGAYAMSSGYHDPAATSMIYTAGPDNRAPHPYVQSLAWNASNTGETTPIYNGGAGLNSNAMSGMLLPATGAPVAQQLAGPIGGSGMPVYVPQHQQSYAPYGPYQSQAYPAQQISMGAAGAGQHSTFVNTSTSVYSPSTPMGYPNIGNRQAQQQYGHPHGNITVPRAAATSNARASARPRRGQTRPRDAGRPLHTGLSSVQAGIGSNASSLSASGAASDEHSSKSAVAAQASTAAQESLSAANADAKSSKVRSDHVLWVGNVPANATIDELHKFFSQLPAPRDEDAAPTESSNTAGIVSIFIIARSNCAFINYDDAKALEHAVSHFNGKVLRPDDSRCHRFVCRVRKKDDEAQAGVAGQRRKGLHVAYLKEHRKRTQDIGRSSPSTPSAPTSDFNQLASRSETPRPQPTVTQPPANTEGEAEPHRTYSSPSSNPPSGTSVTSSSAEVSYTSTNSDLLRHPAFRTRYFILKAKDVEDLHASVASSMWATQLHNEQILGQAYRNSEAVYLIFSANGSGVFFGYAKMAGDPNALKAGTSAGTGADMSSDSVAPAAVVSSPLILTPADEVNDPAQTAASLGRLHMEDDDLPAAGRADSIEAADGQLSNGEQKPSTARSQTLDDGVRRKDMASGMEGGQSLSFSSLGPGDSASSDARAASQLATRAIIHNLRLDQRETQQKAEQLERQLLVEQQLASAGTGRAREDGATTAAQQPVEGIATPRDANPSADQETFGTPFPIQWVTTTPLPFSVVKHLRNPWYENKSLRIARDGTEVAIDTGVELLKLWEQHLAGADTSTSPTTSTMRRKANQ